MNRELKFNCISLSIFVASASLLVQWSECFLFETSYSNNRCSTTAFNSDISHFTRRPPGIQNTNKAFGIAERVLNRNRLVILASDTSPSNDRAEEDEEEDIDLSDQDWRDFRAKLVLTEDDKDATNAAPSMIDDPDDLDGIGHLFFQQQSSEEKAREHFNIVSEQWAYESGNVIEQGAVILGGVEQEFGFGLHQQYFHKAAILVLYHDENVHTKGIILNRPSDRMLIDPDNPGVSWRVWFGGDVQGIDSWNPDIVCLHSLESESASEVSVPVMKNIKWTTFEGAKKLVKLGKARPSDFWVFCGYAGWGPKQLMGELGRKSWYMVATDSQTLLKELARQASEADPRDAGLDTWELLMKMIGREDTAKETVGDFDDLMLKEWARKYLVTENAQAAQEQQKVRNGASTRELLGISAVDKLLKKAADFVKGRDVQVGMLVRASSADRSPFLLDKQQLHKSVVLVISDDDELTVGVMLNRPTPKFIEVNIANKKIDKKRTVAIPIRYGGEYAVRGRAPLLWLHCNENMRKLNIGAPLGPNSEAVIWTCHPDQVSMAIEQQLAEPQDFMVVSGVSVWTKGDKGKARGIQGEVAIGNFEVVPSNKIPIVFKTLLAQEILSGVNLFKMLELANEAWSNAGIDEKLLLRRDGTSDPDNVMNGISDGYDEDDESFVFKSNVKVKRLSDDALKSWMSTFLLSFGRVRK